jgi:hypothetical protein
MKHRIFLLCAAGGLTALLTWGASIDGKWTAQVQGRNGAQTQTLTLKSNGSTLTGSLDTGRGSTDIAEGKVDGSDVSFKVTRAGRSGNTTTAYAGKLMGDDLNLTPTREGGGGKGGAAQVVDFKRVK